jgi:hypothetical protein
MVHDDDDDDDCGVVNELENGQPPWEAGRLEYMPDFLSCGLNTGRSPALRGLPGYYGNIWKLRTSEELKGNFCVEKHRNNLRGLYID